MEEHYHYLQSLCTFIGIFLIVFPLVIFFGNKNDNFNKSICIVLTREANYFDDKITWSIQDKYRLNYAVIREDFSIKIFEKYKENNEYDCIYNKQNLYQWKYKPQLITIFFIVLCEIIGFIMVIQLCIYIYINKSRFRQERNIELTIVTQN